ncbi:MAG TPA: PAS domain S-box protein [Candidatus Acidoferrum sp.]|nr:PAS domain S-box protein [Candidatus Acidoferrum sp.]
MALAVGLACIIALGALQYRAARRSVEDNRWVSHTQEVLRELEAAQMRLNDADACAQSFAISGDSSGLPSCQEASQKISEHLQNLRALVTDSSSQQHKLASLEALIGVSLRAIQQEIDLRKSGELGAAGLAELESSIRKSVRDTHAAAGEMQGVELELLHQRQQAARQSDHEINLLILSGSLAAFILLSVSGAALGSDMAARRRAQAVLRESEERFRMLVEAVQDYAIFRLDPEGHIVTWNAGAERINGYKASEILGKEFSRLYSEEDIRSGKPWRELEVASKEGRFEDEDWRVRKDGSRFWANIVVTALRDESGKLAGFTKITRDFTERMLAERSLQESQWKLQASEKSLRELSFELLSMQDEERRRIGREMHDSLGQYLSVLKMKLDTITYDSRTGAALTTKQEVDECTALVEECVKEVRTISYLLYPPMLEELGLKSAIPWYLDGFSKRSGIGTTFEIAEDFERLPRDAELILFRVLQESLTNVHRHSGSATANVRVRRAPDIVVLEVTDRGKGVPAGVLEESARDWMGMPGVGLRSMNHRVRQFGGKLELISTDSGTLLRATVPVKASLQDSRAIRTASA